MNSGQLGILNDFFFHAVHQKCEEFAVNRMDKNDFILIKDANGQITEGVEVRRNDEDDKYTIKDSCKGKYQDFYVQKLEHIVEKFIKNHAE